MKEIYQSMSDFNVWANSHILEKVGELENEQLQAATGHSHGTLIDLLFHMMRVEWVWRNLVQYSALQGTPLKKEDFPDLSSIVERWQIEVQDRQDYLDKVIEVELESTIQLTDREGKSHSYIRWQLLTHLFMHSMQHRSEVAAILTGYDKSPGNLDILFFYDEKK